MEAQPNISIEFPRFGHSTLQPSQSRKERKPQTISQLLRSQMITFIINATRGQDCHKATHSGVSILHAFAIPCRGKNKRLNRHSRSSSSSMRYVCRFGVQEQRRTNRRKEVGQRRHLAGVNDGEEDSTDVVSPAQSRTHAEPTSPIITRVGGSSASILSLSTPSTTLSVFSVDPDDSEGLIEVRQFPSRKPEIENARWGFFHKI